MSRQQVKLPRAMQPVIAVMRLMLNLGQEEMVFRLLHMGEGQRHSFFKGYTLSEHDVVVATLARSGTHWMMQIALQIIHRGNADYDYLYDIVAWPEYIAGASLPLADPPPLSPTGYRLIKTHLKAEYVPYTPEAKYITVVRDPKEVFVSSYHFIDSALGWVGNFDITPDEWFDLFFKPHFPFGNWAEHTAGWWALRDRPNVLVIPFNLLKADLSVQVNAVAQLLGVALNSAERAEVWHKASFGYMKNINHKFSPIFPNHQEMQVIRTGQSDKVAALLNADKRTKIDAHFQRELTRLGSDFPYTELFG